MSEVLFRGQALTANKAGYRGGVKIYKDFMQGEGIPVEMVDNVTKAHSKLHGEILDFCAEQVGPTKKDSCTLTLSCGNDTAIWGCVNGMTSQSGGPAKPRMEDGKEVINPETGKAFMDVPPRKTVYGTCEIGLSINLGQTFEPQRERIAKEIEEAFTK